MSGNWFWFYLLLVEKENMAQDFLAKEITSEVK